jgi:hypothetical protein
MYVVEEQRLCQAPLPTRGPEIYRTVVLLVSVLVAPVVDVSVKDTSDDVIVLVVDVPVSTIKVHARVVGSASCISSIVPVQ